ncbi:putative transcriptional regulator, contains C-terminal CBS domain protein [Rubidibacter lacunae KORDI 51-2]|uniref:Putative transcriptional regulator, contains C-terminal CBS domain protein n=1 Tax=Rubidibacter lacunae KORDI 51-2 TaxID=582515 RepID=U5DEB5_9CHRO|nr:CBS domain-containing protein [Rubidibacter lacunae]ERN39966.1 putative transcriptional regulator, contains C-terminal CBS domain protein [Rubidibacter lacunae KORDI 51-2]
MNSSTAASTVADFMTADPVVVNPETPIGEAIALLAQKKVGGLPVVDADGSLVGELSDGDLMWQASGVETPPYVMLLDSVIYLQNPARHDREIHKALGSTVGDVMSDRLHCIAPDQPLFEAARQMHQKGVARLVVVDNKRVVGVISRSDIIRSMAEES